VALSPPPKGYLFGAVGAEDHDPAVFYTAPETEEKADGGSIRPLEIIQDEHQGALLGQFVEHVGILFKDVALLDTAVSGFVDGGWPLGQFFDTIQPAGSLSQESSGTGSQTRTGDKDTNEVRTEFDHSLPRMGEQPAQTTGVLLGDRALSEFGVNVASELLPPSQNKPHPPLITPAGERNLTPLAVVPEPQKQVCPSPSLPNPPIPLQPDNLRAYTFEGKG